MLGWSLPLLLSVASLGAAADAPRPRGVGPEYAKFYKATDSFTCISNPSIKLSVSQINDDFCDCPDGSDEPGTSACAYLSPLSPKTPGTAVTKDTNATLALPGFYCKNKGHNPGYIPFDYVNDGICDYTLCCDGSDEWAHVGGTKCEDRCKEIGKDWRAKNDARIKSYNAALRKKSELVAEAAKMRKEIETWLSDSASQLATLEAKVDKLEKEKTEIERKDKTRVVKSSGQGGKGGVLAGLAKARIGLFNGALSTLRGQRDALQARVVELEDILSAFKEEYNPNFNDEGVKRAVRAWESYAVRDKPSNAPENFEADLNDLTSGADTIPWSDFETGGDESSELDIRGKVYQFEAYLPQPVRDWVDQKLRDLRAFLIENGIMPAQEHPDGESKELSEARSRFDEAARERDDIKRQKSEKEEELKKDFGSLDAFRPLKDKCVSLDSGEYTYEVCWMGRVTQISKKGGSRNDMGNFARFETTYADEDVTADGKGLGTGERVVMKYENGAHCWQGPNRSTTVVLACAENEEIWKVLEEEKCVYRIEAGTPAVCKTAAEEQGTASEGRVRDEL